jgi:hypothetical protein
MVEHISTMQNFAQTHWKAIGRLSQGNESRRDQYFVHDIIQITPFVIADDFEDNLATVKQSESFQKTMTAIQKKVEETTAPKLFEKLKNKYGMKALEKIQLDRSMEFNILDFESKSNLRANEIEEYKAIHHELAAVAVYLDELESLADNGQPIPRNICVAIPEIAKRSIEKLAEPMKQKLDGIVEMATNDSGQATRQAIHAAISKTGGNDEIVQIQLLSQKRNGVTPRYERTYLEKMKIGLDFVNSISTIPAQNIVASNHANSILPNKPEGYDRAFAMTTEHVPKFILSGQQTDRPSIFIHNKNSASVVAHELGHIIEDSDPYVYEMVQTFLHYRVGDEKPQRMANLFPGYGFKANEVGRKNHFDRHFDSMSAYYVGKQYGDNSEILSMGIQALHEDPVKFFKNDPEYANFVVSVLQYKESKRIADAMAAAKATGGKQ